MNSASTYGKSSEHRCWMRGGYSAIGGNTEGWLWLVYSKAACTLRTTPKPPRICKNSIWATTKMLVRCLKPTGSLRDHNACFWNHDCSACARFKFTEVCLSLSLSQLLFFLLCMCLGVGEYVHTINLFGELIWGSV